MEEINLFSGPKGAISTFPARKERRGEVSTKGKGRMCRLPSQVCPNEKNVSIEEGSSSSSDEVREKKREDSLHSGRSSRKSV